MNKNKLINLKKDTYFQQERQVIFSHITRGNLSEK